MTLLNRTNISVPDNSCHVVIQFRFLTSLQSVKNDKKTFNAGELIADIVIKIYVWIETAGYCISSFMTGKNPNGYFIPFRNWLGWWFHTSDAASDKQTIKIREASRIIQRRMCSSTLGSNTKIILSISSGLCHFLTTT